MPYDSERATSDEETWVALVHPGQRLRTGSRMVFEDGNRRLQAEVTGMHFHGRRTVRLWTEDGTPVRDAVDALGHVPLPPYIKRGDAAADRDRYQTVYARERGSIAAPTAGLHFTPALLAALAARGIAKLSITLHVGYGTFQPIRVDRVEDHEMEPERYEVSAETAAALSAAKRDGRRIIAVGTTSTRTLESLAIDATGEVQPGSGEHGAVHSSRPPLPARVGAGHQFPFAALIAHHAGLRPGRNRARAVPPTGKRWRRATAFTATAMRWSSL